ncbi:hypothetical protein [Mesorhizobium sp.]|uniref:hypothetical protein n=1 Tax=Mesorhizobium sp. TaxID=1871066 RepID=UPI001225721D|nr:hypothetical protein [Mesorhizobium sp.]TIL34626.1 MAG: hypothetical protein E5Y85_09750 [Mesorhizobium sp.]
MRQRLSGVRQTRPKGLCAVVRAYRRREFASAGNRNWHLLPRFWAGAGELRLADEHVSEIFDMIAAQIKVIEVTRCS